MKVKYRLPNSDYKLVSQSFTEYKKDYTLDEHNNILIESGTLTNCQEMIQSAEESTFDKSLSRLLPPEVLTQDQKNVAKLRNMQTDLAELGAAFELAENYRTKYKLSDDLSPLDIFKHVSSESEKLKNAINEKRSSVSSSKKDKQISDLKKKLDDVKASNSTLEV